MTFLIIGSGRVAKHMTHYMSLLNIKHLNWSRHQSIADLQAKILDAGKILLLISDDALSDFVESQLNSVRAKTIHFSGATQIPGVLAIHPLMTFGRELYSLAEYQAIHFVQFSAKAKSSLDPLPNPIHHVSAANQQKYHSLCVLAGNYTQYLWKKFFTEMQGLGLPPEAASRYMEQNFKNILANPLAQPSGPLGRGDVQTLKKNISALNEDPYQNVYRSFVMAEKPEVIL